MQSIGRLIAFLFVLGAISGCASSKVSDRQQMVKGDIPKPDHILIYEFIVTTPDAPTNLAAANHSTKYPV